MSGVINDTASSPPAPTPAAPAQPGGGLSNPLLRQVEEKIESNILDPKIRQNYMKIVVAGLHVALAKGPDGGMASLLHSNDPIAAAAQGAVALVLTMRKHSNGAMPVQAMIPAGMTLMCHGLDFIDRSGIAKIAEPELDEATKIYANTMFHKMGITPAMLQQMAGRVHALTQDPEAMAKINLKMGVTRNPMAATPTPLPGGLMNGPAAGDAGGGAA